VIRWKAGARVGSAIESFGNQSQVQPILVLGDEYCRMIATTSTKLRGNVTTAINWGINQADTLVQKPRPGRLSNPDRSKPLCSNTLGRYSGIDESICGRFHESFWATDKGPTYDS